MVRELGHIRAVLQDGRSSKVSVTRRTLFKQREFKTVVGLLSFLVDMGFRTARIPGAQVAGLPPDLTE